MHPDVPYKPKYRTQLQRRVKANRRKNEDILREARLHNEGKLTDEEFADRVTYIVFRYCDKFYDRNPKKEG